MTNFIGNPKTTKLETVQGDPGTGLYCYRYDEKNIKPSDLKQILMTTEVILGSVDDVKVISEPASTTSLKVHLSIKNRSNIELGLLNLK